MKSFLIPVSFLFILLWAYTSFAGLEEQQAYNFTAAQQEINKIDQGDLQATSLAQIEILMQQVRAYVDQGKQCESITQQELEQVDKALIAIGEKVTGESKDVAKERSRLLALKSQGEVRRAQCRLLTLRASDLEQKLQKNKKQIFTRDLFSRGPGIIEVVRQPEIRSPDWLKAGIIFFLSRSGLDSLAPYHFAVIILFAGLGFFIGRRVDYLFTHHVGKIEREGFFFDFLRTTGQRKRTFQLSGALVGLSLSVLLSMADLLPPPYLPDAVNSLLLALLISIFGKIYGLVLIGHLQENAPEVKTLRFGLFRLHVLALLSGLLCFVFVSPLKTALPEAPFYLIRALLVTFWYGVLLWSFWLACNFSRLQTWRRTIRLFLVLMLGSVTLAELCGYRILAAHILAGTSGTMILLLLLSLGKQLLNEIIGGFGRGKYVWQQNIRQRAGVKKSQVLKGIIWTNSLLKLSLIVAFVYEILRLWGVSRVYASTFYAWLADGFTLGKITIVPSRVGIGFLIFALGWNVVSLFKDKIIRQWLSESELAASVQDALSTVLGYVGYSIVILIALSTAGINFTGLAMVAGALSVGIGFGLQNIVNNLVSGLILLFERPIKRGDWVIVGTTEGYVKKISVRSTIIQTFDRSDVIVPNSELISSQVTNMMLQDVRGRVRVPVGVAYGSNTELVKDLLLEIAQQHPEVITNGTVPYPVVRFQAFGESSLDFELFCHLKDVDKRLDVRSDMHFSIDKSFRKHGIEIPFPQRDLHVKNGLHEAKENETVDQESPGIDKTELD